MKKIGLIFKYRNISYSLCFIFFIAIVGSVASCKEETLPKPKEKEKPYCYLENGVKVCYDRPK